MMIPRKRLVTRREVGRIYKNQRMLHRFAENRKKKKKRKKKRERIISQGSLPNGMNKKEKTKESASCLAAGWISVGCLCNESFLQPGSAGCWPMKDAQSRLSLLEGAAGVTEPSTEGTGDGRWNITLTVSLELQHQTSLWFPCC